MTSASKKPRKFTQKVRRDATGGRRGLGNTRRAGKRKIVKRPRAAKVLIGAGDKTVSGVGGLVAFGAYVDELGVDGELAAEFGALKGKTGVAYSMMGQIRLLMDTFVAGESRPFGVEALASDPVFAHLAGGSVPSVDTIYRDVARFDETALIRLESMMARHGLAMARGVKSLWVHMDIDTSVLPCFGEKEGALPGPNPRYRGRPSFHPILARIAETDTLCGLRLRPGDRNFGADDLPCIIDWVQRAKAALQPGSELCVRMDAAGDFGSLLAALHREHCFYVIKAKTTSNILGAATMHATWRTTDVDADGIPTRQVAELPFSRAAWQAEDCGKVRVIAVRSRDRQGKQLAFLDDIEWTLQVFLSNRPEHEDINDIAWDYDGRAGVEPLIAEMKGDWGIGETSFWSFSANHAVVLIKALAHNLLRRYRASRFPRFRSWRTDWLRKTLINVPARLVHSGRSYTLRLAHGSPLLCG